MDQLLYNHIRPSAQLECYNWLFSALSVKKCCTRVNTDQALENRACLLAANRVYHLIPCCDSQRRSRSEIWLFPIHADIHLS